MVMTETFSMTCLSLNARGLLNKDKRDTIRRWLSNQKPHVVFLQETHFTKNVTEYIDLEWSGKTFPSYGTNQSRGVTIVINDKSGLEIIDCHADNTGRLLMLNCQYNNDIYCFVNVYGPNCLRERAEFYKTLVNWIREHQLGHLIIGGDFNDTINNKVDRKPESPKHARKKTCLNKFIKQINVIDIWREKYPLKQQFTWRQILRDNRMTSSRLDYWFVDNYIHSRVETCDIRPRFRSDHMSVVLKVKLNRSKRGPGYWKMNTMLLKDDYYNTRITQEMAMWLQYTKENKLSARLTWEYCKIKITECSINYSTQKAKEKRHIIQEMELELEKVCLKLDGGGQRPILAGQEKYASTKHR